MIKLRHLQKASYLGTITRPTICSVPSAQDLIAKRHISYRDRRTLNSSKFLTTLNREKRWIPNNDVGLSLFSTSASNENVESERFIDKLKMSQF